MRGRTIARVSSWCAVTLGALAAPALACPPSEEQIVALGQLQGPSAQRDAVDRLVADTAFADAMFASVGLFAVLFASLVVVAALAYDARRSLRRHTLGAGRHGRQLAEVDATLVEDVARDRLAMAFAVVALGVVAAVGVFATMPVGKPAPHMLLFAPSIVLIVRGLAALVRTRRVLARLPLPDVTVRYDGTRFVFLLAGDQLLGWLVAWPRTLERVNARHVPHAQLRPR